MGQPHVSRNCSGCREAKLLLLKMQHAQAQSFLLARILCVAAPLRQMLLFVVAEFGINVWAINRVAKSRETER